MNGRRLSLAALVVLFSACLIAPPNAFGENPWDPDSPGAGGNVIITVVDSTLVIDTGIVIPTLINGSSAPSGSPDQQQPQQAPQMSQTFAASWMPVWLRELLFYTGSYFGF